MICRKGKENRLCICLLFQLSIPIECEVDYVYVSMSIRLCMGGGFGGNMSGMGDGNEGGSRGVHGNETLTHENVDKEAIDNDDRTTIHNGTTDNEADAN